jgi:hypothetical protein
MACWCSFSSSRIRHRRRPPAWSRRSAAPAPAHPRRARCKAGYVGLFHESLVGAAPVRQDADTVPALDAVAEAVLMGGDTLEPVRREVAHACPLIRISEDAGYAAQPRAAQPICRGRNDSVATQRLPHLGLTKRMHGSPVIDMSSATAAIRAGGFEGCVTRAGSDFQIRLLKDCVGTHGRCTIRREETRGRR